MGEGSLLFQKCSKSHSDAGWKESGHSRSSGLHNSEKKSLKVIECAQESMVMCKGLAHHETSFSGSLDFHIFLRAVRPVLCLLSSRADTALCCSQEMGGSLTQTRPAAVKTIKSNDINGNYEALSFKINLSQAASQANKMALFILNKRGTHHRPNVSVWETRD